MDFVIYRETWRRGGRGSELQEKYGLTALRNSQNRMCCLGQIGHQCGVELENLYYSTLASLSMCNVAVKHWAKLKEAGLIVIPGLRGLDLLVKDDHAPLARDAMRINDSPDITAAEREERLTGLFEAYQHTLTFVDGVAPWFDNQLPCVVQEALAATIEQLPEPVIEVEEGELVCV